tara:strand:+ start:268 stop:519 length:252 start_codon:yes stop_codon:yes gene_type:complete
MANNDAEHNGWLADFVRLIVLTWSLICLSMSYLGQVQAMDPTFSASLLTAILSQYGVAVGKNTSKKDDSNKLDTTKTTPPAKP